MDGVATQPPAKIETGLSFESAAGAGDRYQDPSTGTPPSTISGPKYDFTGIIITGISSESTIGR
jgi:hypothetical protein